MFGSGNSGAQYLDALASQNQKKAKVSKKSNRSLRKTISTLIISIVGLLLVASSLQLATISVAAADDGSDQAKNAIDELMGEDRSQASFESLFAQSINDPSDSTFASVIGRLFSFNYGNDVSLVVGAPDYYCNTGNSGNGTLTYHNCDIPNIITEFSQDVISLFFPTGAYGAEISSNTMVNPGFGIVVDMIPGSKVPIDRSGVTKYTALEIFGYNLKYSAYLGEWDHVKVLTSARLFSNFGLMDHLTMGANTVFNSVSATVNSVSEGGKQFASDLAKGDVIGSFMNFFSNVWSIGEAGGATAVNTILESSDWNVVQQNAWYRVNYPATAYGTRQLSSEEMSVEALSSMTRLIDSGQPDSAKLPSDFPLEKLPERPKEAISSCSVKQKTGSTWGLVNVSSGLTAAQCESQGNSTVAAYGSESEGIAKPYFEWKEEGAQAKETIADWKAANSAIFDGASKYNIGCGLDEDEGNRAANLTAFYSCWPGEWARASKAELVKQQLEENNLWRAQTLSVSNMAAWIASNNDANFNAPYNRFVCVDNNGKDLLDGSGHYLRVYNADGSLTGNCAGTRPPIQNGLFGSGYNGGEGQNPGVDTRRDAYTLDLFDLAKNSTDFGNLSLSLSSLATRVSNSALAYAFTPILETLNIRELIATLITDFRDGIFMPLAALIAAFAALSVFIKFVRSQAFTEAITSFLYMVFAFIVAVVILAYPAKTLKFIDEAPMYVENTVMSAIFGSGSDQLCTATGVNGSPVQGISGVVTNQKGVIRTLTCENWRAFVFTPWVYGQWGDSYEKLYANGYANGNNATTGVKNGSLSNMNNALVGNATVQMGGGQNINNWALYQLQTQTAGTTTTQDTGRATGVVDNNWYRVVDAQAGPNNGANTDGTYFQAWSGKDAGNRIQIAMFSPFIAGLGAVTIVLYSVLKIGLSITSVILLVFLPFIALIAIQPTFGRRMMKSYVFQLLGLMIQRIFITLIVAIMLKVVLAAAASSTGYLMIALVTGTLLMVFLSYRKDLLGMIQKAMDSAGGAFMGGQAYGGLSALKSHLPTTSIDNAMGQAKGAIKGGSAGLAAGILTRAGAKETYKLMKASSGVSNQRIFNSQIKQGLGFFQNSGRIAKAVDDEHRKRYNGESMRGARGVIRGAIAQDQFDEKGDYKPNSKERNQETGERDFSRQGLVSENDGRTIQMHIGSDEEQGDKYESIGRQIGGVTHERRDLEKIKRLQDSIDKAEQKEFKKNTKQASKEGKKNDKARSTASDRKDPNFVAQRTNSDPLKTSRTGYEEGVSNKRIERKKEQLKTIREQEAEWSANEIERAQGKRERREDLTRMINEAKIAAESIVDTAKAEVEKNSPTFKGKKIYRRKRK